MAVFPDDVINGIESYKYELGINSIRDAFRCSIETLEANTLRLKKEAFKSLFGTSSEDGVLPRTPNSVAEMEWGNAVNSESFIRKAFIMLAFHHWENAARTRVGMNGDFDVLKKRSRCQPHPKLRSLNTLNNIIKHAEIKKSSEKIPDMFDKWPELKFDNGYAPKTDSLTRNKIRLDNKIVEEAFDIVAFSAPKYYIK